MIDEEMNDEDEISEDNKNSNKSMEDQNPEQVSERDALGHFDEFGQFKYNHSDRDPQE